jgi:HSP20 family protein
MNRQYFLPERKDIFPLIPRLLSNDFFGSTQTTERFMPNIDVTSDEHGYTIKAEVSGIPNTNLHLEINDDVLTLSGEKTEEHDNKECHVHERRFGSFTRSMTLPKDADAEHITAQQKDGVLCVHIPKCAEAQPRKIGITQC